MFIPGMMKAAAAAICLSTLAGSAVAEDWTPPGPIKLMIAFAAGGGADTQARLIAEDIETRHGWNFIPEQVTGKGGMNLAMALKDQPNDGSVIGMVVSDTLGYSMAVANAGVTPDDFTAITATAKSQMAFVSRSTSGWKSWNDVVEAGKGGKQIRLGAVDAHSGDVAYILSKAGGIEVNIVTVPGGKDILNGLYAGDIDVGFLAGPQAKGVAAGELVNLISLMPEPLDQTPDAPLLADMGVPFAYNVYFTFIGPAGMPDATRDALAAAITEAVTTDGTKSNKMITSVFGSPVVLQGQELQAVFNADFEAAGKLIEAVSK